MILLTEKIKTKYKSLATKPSYKKFISDVEARKYLINRVSEITEQIKSTVNDSQKELLKVEFKVAKQNKFRIIYNYKVNYEDSGLIEINFRKFADFTLLLTDLWYNIIKRTKRLFSGLK